MADLISNSTGNFTTAATWSLVDSSSMLNSEANSTATTTAFVSSSTFTPGAITTDGIAVKVSAHTNPGSGTFSVRLFNSTLAAAVAGTTVTINVTDLPIVNTSTQNGWVFMKFAAPVLLIAVTNYTVQVTSSVNATVTLYRDATAANWSRLLRTTTTQAPASNDFVHVMGDYSSAGSNNTYTVTMDNADAGATTFGRVGVSAKGILKYGVAASTNYYLKVAEVVQMFTGGIFHIGDLATPIPSTSTASLEIVCSSNVQYGVEVRLGGEFKTGGNPITNSAMLATDASAAATSLTTNVSTGWKSGDVIALASTTRTASESESKALTANASGTTLTITAITNAHSGSGATAGELINLTRNVKIFSTSTTNQTYINIVSTSIVDMQATECYNMGSATALKRGIDVATTTGSCTISNCSIHDFNVASSVGINVSGAAANNYTLSNNVIYNTASSGLAAAATTGTAWTISSTISVLTGATGIAISDLGGTISSITGISATGPGIVLTDVSGASTNVFGSLSGFTAHSNTTLGLSLASIFAVTNNPKGLLSTINVWRNTTNGLNISNVFSIDIDTVTAFGNGTANVTFGGTDCSRVNIKNITANAGTTLTCPIGLNITGDTHDSYIDDSSFGATTAHATGDVNVSGVGIIPQITFRNVLRSSSVTFSNSGNMTVGGYVGFAKDQQTAGNNRMQRKYGTIVADTTIFRSASPSVRLTPNNAATTNKMQSFEHKLAILSGATATIRVYVRKSVVGDGTAYNGNQVRLILRSDPAAGPTTETVLASSTNAANGAFEQIGGTTVAAVDNAAYTVHIDCDGTTGWVNYQDWELT